ncbi:hypothetical protein [Streptomyces venezuelae]|uniref:hypothetical protein n=1 Tax=Streptomyces venezuelae TaxID=54571 RepID=UPI00168A0089|nr:hypothetical protein [Streptomyces venezuelae]
MYDDEILPGTPLFDDEEDDGLGRRMAGPSPDTARLIGQHLVDRQAEGRAPYWPDWDE